MNPDTQAPAIMWFRNDLRRRDNPALAAAAREPVLALYVVDDGEPPETAPGAASRWWLHHSLAALDASLEGALHLRRGDPAAIITALCAEHGSRRVCWNRCHDPHAATRDAHLKAALTARGIRVEEFPGTHLWEPGATAKDDGSAYQVFTPWYKNAMARLGLPAPAAAPPRLTLVPCPQDAGKLERLALLPKVNWHGKLAAYWQPGEDGAAAAAAAFLEDGLRAYPEGRDFPARPAVSRLSPHLRFGEISPRELAHHAVARGESLGAADQAQAFIRQLAWREFSWQLLHHWPDLPRRNMRPAFDRFPWRDDDEALERWQRGATGYPIVDAGMRQLWEEGYMHNRVRMIVASFLTKNLMIHWRRGAAWFHDCLVDADLANNTVSWQWVAGCGADAAPYFRIFNPVTQSVKFDEEGDYLKRHVPELERLHGRALHDPGNAPPLELAAAGLRLGTDYPRPLVALGPSRERALAAYRQLAAGSRQ